MLETKGNRYSISFTKSEAIAGNFHDIPENSYIRSLSNRIYMAGTNVCDGGHYASVWRKMTAYLNNNINANLYYQSVNLNNDYSFWRKDKTLIGKITDSRRCTEQKNYFTGTSVSELL